MSVYTPFIALAKRLITKYGMDVTAYSPVVGAPVVAGQDWKPTNGTAIQTALKMAFLPEETINFYSKTHSLIAREDYQVGYEYYLLGAYGFTPEINQVIVKSISGEKWNVRYVLRYAPADEIVLWIVGLKR